MGKSELVLYQPDSTVSVEVRLENENVWLNRQQISVLFDRDIKTKMEIKHTELLTAKKNGN